MSQLYHSGMANVAIESVEYYLPQIIETGSTLKEQNPEWSIHDIENKTGISTRYISAPDETALDMAVKAAEKLFLQQIDRQSIGALIFVTQSSDYVLPTSACIIQDRLGLSRSCISFDVNQGCSGFVYGLALSSALVTAGFANKVLLLCAETYSKYIDKHDRTCRPIFSDGAAATLLTRSARAQLGPFELGSDGSGALNLIVAAGGARQAQALEMTNKKLFMDGARVLMFSMSAVPKCVVSLLEKSGKSIEEIDLFVFHQASKLVIDNIIRHLSLPKEKVFCNYQRVGNTVSASIPIALKDAVNEGRLKEGDLVMSVGFGVGYSWGACLLEWGFAK